ncbi:hypothetical protein AMELA_G00277370 [Ameiurus melas]|uniref:Uncharacterized protein n=1 Tax=Ameiurus melas TaxID=219545 RepID=A0A7J5ZLG1_AMEME|nr:hypothetical protein AMELA_G00277370 [Ameiurus melas]
MDWDSQPPSQAIVAGSRPIRKRKGHRLPTTRKRTRAALDIKSFCAARVGSFSACSRWRAELRGNEHAGGR